METERIKAVDLRASDYIITSHLSPEPPGEWSSRSGTAWLVKQVQLSGDIVFVTASGHDINDNIWYNRPGTIFHFTFPAEARVSVQHPRKK